MRSYAVVTPAYRPTEQLPGYIRQLIDAGVAEVIVVNDGSGPEFDSVFKALSHLDRCTLLRHERNSGKGVALKTAFRYFMKQDAGWKGLVTADADGQHAVEDVLRTGDKLVENEADFVLGMRTFEPREVPLRSMIGNTLTTNVFKWLFGYYIRDTQTGLRGIASDQVDWILRLRGERYEYEINMLINIAKRRKRLLGVDIQTIYHDRHVSYYNTYKDSFKIIWQLMRGYVLPPHRTEV